MNQSATPQVRRVARAIIVDAQRRILLFRAELPDRDPWWFAPGGALEQGETYAAALVREVMEETGIGVDIGGPGPPVWIRDSMFTWMAQPERHLERFFLVRVATHDVDTSTYETCESHAIRTYRWWSLDEILLSPERFSPVNLGTHLAPLLEGRLPERPVAVGE
jgi:ADP-ribose pyrophosphatase YjhB (NUDIX family)